MTVTFTLYSTSFCHLCEQAQQLLAQLDMVAEVVDIAEYDHLYQEYGLRIPVVKRNDTGAELGWPFDISALGQFIA